MFALREPFQAELYVERADLTDSFVDWVKSPRYRLRSLVGAAGSGKSWFMAHLFLRLREQTDVLPLWLDLSSQPLHPDGRAPVQVGNETGRLDWLQDIIQYATSPKNRIPYDRTASFAANFEHFTTRICGLQSRVVLLVDSFDELPRREIPAWEEHVFSPFLSAACTHLIIARRNVDALTHPVLRWNDEVIELPGLEVHEQQQQVKARLYNEPDRQMLDLTLYLTANPYINTLLLKRSGNKPRLSSEDLDACVQEVMQRVNLPEPSKKTVWELVAKLPRAWKAWQLSKETGMRIDDLEGLFKSGVVSHVPGTAMYETDAGIYQLVKQSLEAQHNQ